MGLDMFAFATDRRPAKPVDFKPPESADEIYSWRKHPDLHGWMEALYFRKGGHGIDGMDGPGTFNCVPVLIEPADLDELEQVLDCNSLPHTEGFFFGASGPEDIVGDRVFIAKARAVIAEGKSVYYTSWW